MRGEARCPSSELPPVTSMQAPCCHLHVPPRSSLLSPPSSDLPSSLAPPATFLPPSLVTLDTYQGEGAIYRERMQCHNVPAASDEGRITRSSIH